MRPAEFTKEEIVAAGKELVAAGHNVTGFALRTRIGGGNATRLRQVWEDEMTRSTAHSEPAIELPIELVEQLEEGKKALADVIGQQLGALAQKLNDKARKAAERRITEIEQQAQAARAQAGEELADAQRNIEKVEDECDAAKGELAQSEQRLAALQELAHAKDVEIAQLAERLAQAERAVQVSAELADKAKAELHAKLESEAGETAELRAKLEAAERASQAQRQQAATEVQRQAERANELKAERDAANKEAKAAREEAKHLTGRLDEMQSQRAELMKLLKGKQPAETKAAPPPAIPAASRPKARAKPAR